MKCIPKEKKMCCLRGQHGECGLPTGTSCLLSSCPASLLLLVFLTVSLAATPSDLSVITLLPALETLAGHTLQVTVLLFVVWRLKCLHTEDMSS